ncbi:MAG: hypothetical protein J0I47_00920 [Sphingomonas sp.]|uniref:hypothetical protein n=1 Tax=Sphingomonas sp. TaxID=28214 RepID=UPI001AD14F21|nr:hypothetical protein [Sphingomonas sp.]MBN8806791.1 hypothetical protein [Sphingomonas sp.]
MSQTLEDYHERLEAMMIEGEALIATRDPAREDLVRRKIGQAGLVMASYQLFVHREVFVPLLDRADPATRARVTEIKVECIALTEDLRFKTRDFLAKTGPLDWEATAISIGWFNTRVRQHIAAIRELMDPKTGAAFLRRIGTVGVAA